MRGVRYTEKVYSASAHIPQTLDQSVRIGRFLGKVFADIAIWLSANLDSASCDMLAVVESYYRDSRWKVFR